MKMREYNSALLHERYFEILHPCGLPIYVFPKNMTGTYAILAVRYGAMDTAFRTRDGECLTVPDGVAHFLEHKLYENPDGSDSFAKFSEYGADANAYTTSNRTAYLFGCTDRFAESLTELLTFVTTPYFTPETVQKEQGIIAEEIRMYDDSPWDRCFQNLMESMYAVCGIRRNICGSERSISRITSELLRTCYDTFYQPANMALVVCGNVTPDDVLTVCNKVLPQRSSNQPIERFEKPEPPEVLRPFTEAKMQVAKPIFTLGFKDPVLPRTKQERARRYVAMNLLDEAIFSRSGALYGALFDEGLLTASYSYGYSNTDRCAFHTISGEGDDPQEIERRILAHLSDLSEHGIPPQEIERARRVLYSDELQSYDSTEEIANELLSYLFDGADMFAQPDLINSVTADEVQALLPSLLLPNRRCLSVIRPL